MILSSDYLKEIFNKFLVINAVSSPALISFLIMYENESGKVVYLTGWASGVLLATIVLHSFERKNVGMCLLSCVLISLSGLVGFCVAGRFVYPEWNFREFFLKPILWVGWMCVPVGGFASLVICGSAGKGKKGCD